MPFPILNAVVLNVRLVGAAIVAALVFPIVTSCIADAVFLNEGAGGVERGIGIG